MGDTPLSLANWHLHRPLCSNNKRGESCIRAATFSARDAHSELIRQIRWVTFWQWYREPAGEIMGSSLSLQVRRIRFFIWNRFFDITHY